MTYIKPNISALIGILSQRRPAHTKGEIYFVEKWLMSRLPNPRMDTYGNVFVTVGDDPKTMFSAHTDTVHHKDGIQKVAYDDTKHHFFTDDPDSNCLGADDGTGIWLMMHMINNKVPGLYVFHRDEEIGGGGSSHITRQVGATAAYETFRHCIAFDRKGYSDIITHQGGTRTASDDFANTLAAQLGQLIPGFKACDGGSFTDSKNYRHIIPECTNLSVGYFDQHTKREHQDLAFAVKLAHALCKVDWNAVASVRDPKALPPPRQTYAGFNEFGGYGGMFGGDDNFGRTSTKPAKAKKPKHAQQQLPLANSLYKDAATFRELEAWARDHPTSAALILYNMAITKGELLDAESDVRSDPRYRPLVVQRPSNVRTLPVGGQETVHRPAAEKAAPGSGSRKLDS